MEVDQVRKSFFSLLFPTCEVRNLHLLIGKTTLLNLIAGRIPHSCLKDANSSVPYEGSGFIRYGKEEFNRQQLRERIGYGELVATKFHIFAVLCIC